MSARKIAPYEAFAELILALRLKAGIGKQIEFANLLGCKQQSVSRWERGLSRPRDKDIPLIASVLKADIDELLIAAGYIKKRAIATFDQPFPIDALTPDSFERFALHFLSKQYPNAQVHRAGGTGHKQHGLDIEVTFPDGTIYTFQCKREAEFGAAKASKAIAAHTRAASKKFILLSRIASPGARAAAAAHTEWDIWDIEDIALRIRELTKLEQIELVDLFFRGQRLALLGETEAGPWQTVSAYFAPFQCADRAFNHTWELVGRESEIEALRLALSDQSVPLIFLSGAGGVGKSRVLSHVLDMHTCAHPGAMVRMLSAVEEVTAKSLEDLGAGDKLLVVDDAHDRDDLGTLLRFTANPSNRSRLLLSFRPYGRERIRNQAATLSLSGGNVSEVALLPLTLAAATKLAVQVLRTCDGPEHAATDIARVTVDSPLATVVAAQVVSREGLHPELLRNDEQFRHTILSRFEKVITGEIAVGQDAERLRKMLRIFALVQPLSPDDPQLLALLEQVEGVLPPDANRLIKLLTSAGILFKRGIHYRLSPDLLADAIIEESCINVSAHSTGYAERVFDAAASAYLDHLLVNLGKLDWRRGKGDTTNSTLLAGLWSRLTWQGEYQKEHVHAAANAAYYQPRQALQFARTLIHSGHGTDEDVCRIVRNAAYSIEHLIDACTLLWEAGHDDRRALNQHPNHGIRLLVELATPEPNKPSEFVDQVVDFALSLLDSPENLASAYTPFDILGGALAAEGHFTSASTSRAITISMYAVERTRVEAIRLRVIDALIASLADHNHRRAFLAAQLFSSALRGPVRPSNREATASDEGNDWGSEFVETLTKLDDLLNSAHIAAPVLVRLAESVSWHAYYGPESTAEISHRILARLSRDLHTRTIRLLVDGWGSNTWPIDNETHERSTFEMDTATAIRDLRQQYPDAAQLAQYLSVCLTEIAQVAAGGHGTPHIFLNRLIAESRELAREVLRLRLSGVETPLAQYGGVALGAMLAQSPNEARAQIAALLAEDNAHLLLVAEGYLYCDLSKAFSTSDIDVLRAIFDSQDPRILRYTPHIARAVAQRDKLLAIELFTRASGAAAHHAIHDFFMWIVHEETIPFALIRDDQLELILEALRTAPKLDDHWVNAFFKKATKRSPRLVLTLAKGRLEDAIANNDWSINPLGSRYGRGSSLRLLDHADGGILLRELLDWALTRISGSGFAYRFADLISSACGTYDAAFIAALESWLAGGTPNHFVVAAIVLREAQPGFIYAHGPFVRRVLALARTAGKKSLQAVSSAIYAAAISGLRSGTPGKPFPFDLEMKAHAEEQLATMGRLDPAFGLYTDLLENAKDGIERQLRQGKRMDEEDAEA